MPSTISSLLQIAGVAPVSPPTPGATGATGDAFATLFGAVGNDPAAAGGKVLPNVAGAEPGMASDTVASPRVVNLVPDTAPAESPPQRLGVRHTGPRHVVVPQTPSILPQVSDERMEQTLSSEASDPAGSQPNDGAVAVAPPVPPLASVAGRTADLPAPPPGEARAEDEPTAPSPDSQVPPFPAPQSLPFAPTSIPTQARGSGPTSGSPALVAALPTVTTPTGALPVTTGSAARIPAPATDLRIAARVAAPGGSVRAPSSDPFPDAAETPAGPGEVRHFDEGIAPTRTTPVPPAAGAVSVNAPLPAQPTSQAASSARTSAISHDTVPGQPTGTAPGVIPEARAMSRDRATILAPAQADPRATPPVPTAAAPVTPALDTAAQLVRRPLTVRPEIPRAAAPDEPSPAPVATVAPLAAVASPVAAAAHQLPIDTTRDTWPSAMVDRIERLRDAADAVSTSIRVIPDALGAIDVSVRREGEVTHVQLAAEHAQTRALLTEAQPKLAEIAEARGLRLGQAEVGGGSASTDGGRPTPQQHAPRQPATPSRARTDARASTPQDDRIA